MKLLRTIFGNDVRILGGRDFQTLLLANILPPLGTSLLSPILESLIGPFGTSAADIGLMISFFTAPAIVMVPIAGVLSDRYGRKPILVSALVLFGVAGSAIAFTAEYRVALGLRLLQGVAFGGMTPIIITSIGDIYTGVEEATAQGFRLAGAGLAQAVFPLLAGVLVGIAWHYPFFIYAMALPIAATVFIYLDEPTDRETATAARSVPGTPNRSIQDLYQLVRQRRVLAIVVARGLPMFPFIGFLTYNSIVVVRVAGGTPAQAGLLVAIVSLTFAAAATQAGRLTDLFESRFYPLLFANVCLGLGLTVFLFAPSYSVAGLGVAVLGVGFGLALSLYRSIITGLAGESLRGGLVSLAEALGRLASTIAPLFMGGIIAIATRQVDLATAVQIAGMGMVVIGSLGGVLCLYVARTAASTQYEA